MLCVVAVVLMRTSPENPGAMSPITLFSITSQIGKIGTPTVPPNPSSSFFYSQPPPRSSKLSNFEAYMVSGRDDSSLMAELGAYGADRRIHLYQMVSTS